MNGNDWGQNQRGMILGSKRLGIRLSDGTYKVLYKLTYSESGVDIEGMPLDCGHTASEDLLKREFWFCYQKHVLCAYHGPGQIHECSCGRKVCELPGCGQKHMGKWYCSFKHFILDMLGYRPRPPKKKEHMFKVEEIKE